MYEAKKVELETALNTLEGKLLRAELRVLELEFNKRAVDDLAKKVDETEKVLKAFE